MVNWSSKILSDVLTLAIGLALLALINVLSSVLFFRADLTEEKRFSIKQPTRDMLRKLDDDIFVEVYLAGELNPTFQRFQKSIAETLEEFSIYSNRKVHYSFVDPATAISQKAQGEYMAELASKGIQPTRVFDKKEGQRIEKLIFPGAVLSYGATERGVMLLKGNKAGTPEEEVNQSIEGVEFELANAIYKLTNQEPKRVGVVTGHGELGGIDFAAFRNSLIEVYDVVDVDLSTSNLATLDALIIAKPTSPFSELDKFKLDQYIMKRGNVLLMIDKLEANIDSASRDDYFAFPYNLNLDDQLFKYGVRINLDLVQDRFAARTPVVTGQSGSKPQMQLMEWPFFPLVNRYARHPVTENLDAALLKFASSIDTVKAVGVRKTPLLFTSEYARTVTAPVKVSISSLRNDLKPDQFNKPFIPVGYLLEGKFTSLYKNRFLPTGAVSGGFAEQSGARKIIVVSDGDVARNAVNVRTQQPQPLGFDPATGYTFANNDLLMNMLAFLTDENGLIKARNKEVKLRPLDKQKIVEEKSIWQAVNLLVPLVIILVFGVIRSWARKKRYASF